MICPQCGALVEDELEKCDNCGYLFDSATATAETDENDYNITQNVPAVKEFDATTKIDSVKNRVNFYKLFVFLLSAAVIALSFYGAHFISNGAVRLNNTQLSSAQSIFGFGSGNDASYYQNLGVIYYGIAYAIRALGIGVSGIMLAIGLKKS